MPLPANTIIVSVAPNGARKTKADHPRLPLTADELAACARDLLPTGASVLHLHVRNAHGSHTLDTQTYRAALRAIEREIGDQLIIQITTESAGQYGPTRQMQLVRELRPEAVSLALRELIPSSAHEPEAVRFFQWLSTERIWPQYILHTAEDAQRFESMRRAGLFGTENPFALFVLRGATATVPAVSEELHGFLRAAAPVMFPWAVCAFGPAESIAAALAARLGGHVRVGFENNLLLADGGIAPNNAALVNQLSPAFAMAQRRPATVKELRDAIHRG